MNGRWRVWMGLARVSLRKVPEASIRPGLLQAFALISSSYLCLNAQIRGHPLC